MCNYYCTTCHRSTTTSGVDCQAGLNRQYSADRVQKMSRCFPSWVIQDRKLVLRQSHGTNIWWDVDEFDHPFFAPWILASRVSLTQAIGSLPLDDNGIFLVTSGTSQKMRPLYVHKDLEHDYHQLIKHAHRTVLYPIILSNYPISANYVPVIWSLFPGAIACYHGRCQN